MLAEHIIEERKPSIILYCGLLALIGVDMAITSSPSIVEASDVVQKDDKANPDFFGENGPYAQLWIQLTPLLRRLDNRVAVEWNIEKHNRIREYEYRSRYHFWAFRALIVRLCGRQT